MIQASTDEGFRGQLRLLRQELNQSILAKFFVSMRPGFRDAVCVKKQGFAGGQSNLLRGVAAIAEHADWNAGGFQAHDFTSLTNQRGTMPGIAQLNSTR